MDEEPDRRLSVLKLPKHLAGLLGNPYRVRPDCTDRQVHPTRAHLNEEQHVYCLQEDRLDREKIAGEHLGPIMIEEGPPVAVRPVSLRRGQNVLTPQDIPHRGNADVMAQFLYFALELLAAQTRILSCQTQNQHLEFFAQPRPSDLVRAVSKGPLALHQLPMPFQHCRRLEQE